MYKDKYSDPITIISNTPSGEELEITPGEFIDGKEANYSVKFSKSEFLRYVFGVMNIKIIEINGKPFEITLEDNLRLSDSMRSAKVELKIEEFEVLTRIMEMYLRDEKGNNGGKSL